MADRFDDWSVTADSNTTVDSINIAEQMAPSAVNNAMRAIMASAALSFGGFAEGTSRPSIVAAGSMWLDTTAATAPIIKMYDGSDDITVMTFDYTANTVTISAAVAASGVTVADSGGYFDGSDAETVLADIGANYAKLAAPAFTGSVSMAGELQLDGVVQTPADVFTSSSNAVALVMTGGSKKTLTLDETTTITVSAEVADQIVELWITQGSTGGTAAWSGVDKWFGGSAPTLSTTTGEIDVVVLESASDGSTIVAQHLGVAS